LTFNERAAVFAFTDAQARVSVIMRRTAGLPLTFTGLLDARQAIQDALNWVGITHGLDPSLS
jgi:hypothetical protein